MRDRIRDMVRIDTVTRCWIWQGPANQKGYGQTSITGDGERHSVPAHRASYEAFVGPIPEGLEIDHLCRVKLCVNPKHLEPVTGAENKRRVPPEARDRSHLRGPSPLTREGGTCADCSAELPAGALTGRPRTLCDRCRDLHRIRTHLHLARVLAEDLDHESGLSSAIRIAIQVAVP